jgi:uncharacterized protein (DUF488 family)
MTTPEIVTIGVYGWEAERFFQALRAAEVEAFCDIRQRRGVRGTEYAFANSQRLQARLAEMGIRYVHCKELAPARETREAQYETDRAEGTTKRLRKALSQDFIESYRRERLAGFDSHAFVAGLGDQVRTIALFCVEGEPAACHRSLLAERLASDLGVSVRHILP